MNSRVRDGSALEKTAAYSRAARSGNTIAVSGTAALSDDGVALFPGDIYPQTLEALNRALRAAEKLGAKPSDVIRTRIYLAPDTDWQAAVRAHGEVFEGLDPANTTVFVAGFIPKGCLVEVEIDAVVD